MITLKNIFSIIIIATIISSCESSSKSSEKASLEVSSENLTLADFAIDGMVCSMGCAATIEKDVASLVGVINSDVDYKLGKAHFEFDKAVISENEIIAKIESIADGQYKVKEWVEESKVEDVLELEEVELSEESENSITNVSLPDFKIPNLFTLLLDQI